MVEAKPRILLVDDEVAITSNLAPFLERAGFTVQVAGDGEAALNRLEGFAPHLIILDVLMPKMDGREVCRRLRAAGDWTPILMLTQVGEATERAMTLEEGADDYLNKPFDPHELVARIRAVLRRARVGTLGEGVVGHHDSPVPGVSVLEMKVFHPLHTQLIDQVKELPGLERTQVDLKEEGLHGQKVQEILV